MSYLANIFTRKAKSRFITASIFGSFCFLYPFNKIHKNHDQPPTNNHNSNDINHYNIHYPQNKKATLFFTGSVSSSLAHDVTQMLGTNLYNINVSRFADGETSIKIDESVRGRDVYLFHSTSPPVNDNLMELLLTISTFKNSSAKSITAVIPYFGYSRQGLMKGPRNSISVSDVILMIEAMGCNKVITVDLHSGQIEGFFGRDTTIDNLDVIPIFANYIKDNIALKSDKRLVIASPDARGAPRAKKIQHILEKEHKISCEVATLIRNRTKGQIKGFDMIGNANGANVVLIDDIIDSGDTMVLGAEHMKIHENANKVYSIVTHGIFSNNALERIQKSHIDRLIIYDSIPPKENEHTFSKIERARLAPLIASTISSYARHE